MGNSAPVKAIDRKREPQRFELSEKQRKFFAQQRAMSQEIELAMRGAIRLIIEENEIPVANAAVRLSDDSSALLIEEQQ